MSQVKSGFCEEGHTVNSRTRRATPRSRRASTLTRDERKQRTRQAIIDAALRLLAEDSFSGLSLREVTREAGIVPGAVYRHLDSMEAFGLVLIDECFRSLRDMLRGARGGELDPTNVIESSVDVLANSVEEHRLHWR